MGEIAEMHLDGTLCESCGVFLNEEAPGYPCYCEDCEGSDDKDSPEELIYLSYTHLARSVDFLEQIQASDSDIGQWLSQLNPILKEISYRLDQLENPL